MKLRGKNISLVKLVMICILFSIISSAHGITSPLNELPTSQIDFSSNIHSMQVNAISCANSSRDIYLDKKEFMDFFPTNYPSFSWINVTPLSQTISENSYFTIQISVVPSESIAGVQMELIFNPALIMVENIIEGDLFQGHTNYFHPGIIDNKNGIIRNVFNVILSPQDSVSSPGTFAIITFLSKNSNGNSPLILSNIMIGNPSAHQVPARATNGSVTINIKNPNNPELSDFHLYQGWNLITIPFQTNYTASLLSRAIGNTCDCVARWDSLNQTYHSHPTGTFIDDFPIIPGRGYFIHVWNTTFFTLSGIPLESTTVQLKKGYNLIGWHTQSTITADSLLNNITGCNSVSTWDHLTGAYWTYLSNKASDTFNITSGDGIFVHLLNNIQWKQGQ